MARGLSYADAVRLLGGSEARVAQALDQLTGGLLLAGSASGVGFAASLFDPAGKLARLSGELAFAVSQRLGGLSRFDRSERITAAHAVIVLTAYFEVVGETELPFDFAECELARADQVALVIDGAGSTRLGDLGAALLGAPVPMPASQRPFESTLEDLRRFYTGLSNEVVRFVAGLSVWDRLTDTDRWRLQDRLCPQLSGRAVSRYEELFRRLAGECTEIALWANMVDHQATRARIQRLDGDLAAVKQVLAGIADGRAPVERRMALSQAYRAALERPPLVVGQMLPGLCIPLLGKAYVNPDFRVAPVESADQLVEEAWWARQQVRGDLQGFLDAYLAAAQATEAPLLVLGQPGSGKSVLVTVLAAQLLPSEFLAVIVKLRETPADADVQAQIEHAIRSATGETVAWPDLVRGAGDALPVVLLDGFDELLQATGASQSDYLEKVAEFQRREADQGRPVVVVVTSRTAVADRARSVWGMVAIRLEPFRDGQVRQWLQVWNDTNAAYLTGRGLRPLDPERALAHAELASQPLLLLMLAIYDAADNALQREAAALGRGELYERLLTGFAEREVRRMEPSLAADSLDRAIEHELMRLSVVALAMFNRRRQWVAQPELDKDLPALLGGLHDHRSPAELRARLTAGQVVIGRFFFVHEAQATRDGTRLSTYEFLHATFGEYLVARLVARELSDLAEAAEINARRSRPATVDDSFLHALLSFAALTTRSTTLTFLIERLAPLPTNRRETLTRLLLSLFHEALEQRRSTAYETYEPEHLPVTARHAAYSANLVLLTVLAGDEVSAAELFPGNRDGIDQWRRLTFLWKSQLPAEGWNGLVHALALSREWRDDRRTIRLRFVENDIATPPIDLGWSYANAARRAEQHNGVARWRHYSFEDLRLHSYFMCDRTEDTLMHALEPFAGTLDPAVGTLLRLSDGSTISPAQALITLWFSASRTAPAEDLLAAYETCLLIAVDGFYSTRALDISAQQDYCTLILRQLAANSYRLPPEWVDIVYQRIKDAGQRNPKLLELAREILPDLN